MLLLQIRSVCIPIQQFQLGLLLQKHRFLVDRALEADFF